MLSPLSAVQSITPAFEQTKRQLFKPFRMSHWARLAVVSLVTGEFAGSSGGWGGGNFPAPQSRGKRDLFAFLSADPTWDRIQEFLPWIALGILILLTLFVLWIYSASIYRFILFASVLYDRCELRAGWRRWKPQGRSYFLWSIGFAFATLIAAGVLIGAPIIFAYASGIFAQPRQHLVLLIAGGLLLLLLVILLFVAAAVIGLFAKDFAVPVMALENVGILGAWRRVLPLLAADKLAYAGYVLMKIVLAVGSAIIFGIINLLVLLGLLIPLGIGGAALYFVAKAAGLTWNAGTISVVGALGVFILTGLFYVVALISSPAMVFFQSYTLHFFGSRYPLLGALVFPVPPRPAPTVPPAPAPLPAT